MKALHAALFVVLHCSTTTSDAYHNPSSLPSLRSTGQRHGFVVGTPPLTAPQQQPQSSPGARSTQSSALSVAASTTKSSDADFSAFADSLEEKGDDDDDSGFMGKSATAAGVRPWQAKLEDLLDPMTNNAQRQILLSELLNANEEIRTSALDALTNRRVGSFVSSVVEELLKPRRANQI